MNVPFLFQAVLISLTASCHAGLLGAGFGEGSCAAAPYRYVYQGEDIIWRGLSTDMARSLAACLHAYSKESCAAAPYRYVYQGEIYHLERAQYLTAGSDRPACIR